VTITIVHIIISNKDELAEETLHFVAAALLLGLLSLFLSLFLILSLSIQ
jgi:hypothetical protein